MTSLSARTPKLLFAVALILVATIVATPSAQASEWKADAAHTTINFSVNHFFTPVTGTFGDFDIELDYDEADPTKSSVKAKIAIASIDTGNEDRDNHLRTADFFAAEEHPYLTFESTSVEKVAEGQLVATGNLTIKGISKEIELPISILGVQEIPAEMQEMFGTERVASFRAETAIDRGDYEVGTGNFAATLVVGGEVGIEILVEAHEK
jgi:polyisoprenoid-binding protein YceI